MPSLGRSITQSRRRVAGRVQRERDERSGRAFERELGQLAAYAQFVGWSRSGHSVVGHVLNAHPDALIAYEADALSAVAGGCSWPALVGRLHRVDVELGRRDRVSDLHDYDVPGQWQSRYRTVRVIGDKRGGASARRLAGSLESLVRLEQLAPVPVHLLVVTRHPLDTIARMTTRERLTPLEAIAQFDRMAAGVRAGLDHVGERSWLVAHEDFVADPSAALVALCTQLGLDPEPSWLAACVAIIYESPQQARSAVEWTPALRGLVDEITERYPFLHRYRGD